MTSQSALMTGFRNLSHSHLQDHLFRAGFSLIWNVITKGNSRKGSFTVGYVSLAHVPLRLNETVKVGADCGLILLQPRVQQTHMIREVMRSRSDGGRVGAEKLKRHYFQRGSLLACKAADFSPPCFCIMFVMLNTDLSCVIKSLIFSKCAVVLKMSHKSRLFTCTYHNHPMSRVSSQNCTRLYSEESRTIWCEFLSSCFLHVFVAPKLIP